jgi:hypothetical protein
MMYAVDDKVRGEGRRQGVGHQGTQQVYYSIPWPVAHWLTFRITSLQGIQGTVEHCVIWQIVTLKIYGIGPTAQSRL